MTSTKAINEGNFVPEEITHVKNTNGLFEGKAGKAILLYLLSKHDSESNFSDLAQEMLNEISESIAEEQHLDFANGLAGIGWAVEWIAQNGFLEMNTDDILEEIDDTIYKSVVYSPDKNVSLANGTLGKLLFFLNRYKSKNPNTHRLKNIFHEECLILLTDDLYDKICGEKGLITKENLSNDELINIGHAVYFLSDFLWSKVNEPTVESTLYETIAFIDNLLENSCNATLKTHSNETLLFLSLCYYMAGINHRQNYWCSRADYFQKSISQLINVRQNALLHFVNFALKSIFEQKQTTELVKTNIMENFSLSNIRGKECLFHLIINGKYNKDKGILLLILFDVFAIA